MNYTIRQSVSFEAAHWLPNVKEGHKCGRLHGHRYTITAELEGELDESKGWVRDFAELGAPLNGVAVLLDHRTLNDIAGLENPTAENLCAWVWMALAEDLPVTSVTVQETERSSCTLRK